MRLSQDVLYIDILYSLLLLFATSLCGILQVSIVSNVYSSHPLYTSCLNSHVYSMHICINYTFNPYSVRACSEVDLTSLTCHKLLGFSSEIRGLPSRNSVNVGEIFH